MATSSITKNFVISGKEAVESFIDALETSFNMEVPEHKSCGRLLTDPDEIRELTLKWMKNHGKYVKA